MFEGLNNDLVGLVVRLFPGFLTAWIFYGLTAHDRPSPFERVIQALVFSTIIQALAVIVRVAALSMGHIVVLGTWTQDSTLVCSVLLATLLGLLMARFANTGSLHDWLRNWAWWDRMRESGRLRWLFFFDWSWTSRTSYPSEWYGAFSKENRSVILHLKDGQKLMGYPEQWPDRPNRGHFLMIEATWLMPDGEVLPISIGTKLLVSATDVLMVEFLQSDEDRTAASATSPDG